MSLSTLVFPAQYLICMAAKKSITINIHWMDRKHQSFIKVYISLYFLFFVSSWLFRYGDSPKGRFRFSAGMDLGNFGPSSS